MLPSRKQRREMARKFGLVKKNPSFKAWGEQLNRTVKAGEIIHQAHLQDNHNNQLKTSKENTQTEEKIEWSDVVSNTESKPAE